MDSFMSLATAKICRLCETKDGPFLNIFGPDMDLAKKIENVVFITINEYDDLPHKICFRCSARLEDFQEFLNKCIKAQENLSTMVGKKFAQKNPQTRKIKYTWEAKLNENKISNEQYCDELIKKALELATDFTTKSKESDAKWMKKFNIRNSEIRLWKVDRPHYPGIEKRNGKHFVTDIRKIPKIVPVTPKSTNSRRFSKTFTNTTNRYYENSNKRDINKLTSNTKIILKPVSESSNTVAQSSSKQSASSNAIQSSSDAPTLPENFTTVRVSGVGTVYTCKNCDSVILELQKAFNHKCFNLKSAKTVAFKEAMSPRPRILSNNQPSIKQSPNSNYNRPGPARHKQTVAQYKDVDQDHVVDLDQIPDPAPNQKTSNTSNLQLSNMTMTNSNPNNPNNFFGYQFPTNFYLVPSGNNTFALQAGPPNSQPAANATIPVLQPPQAQPTVSYRAPQDNNSILPDINRPPIYSADRNVATETNNKPSKRSKKQQKDVSATQVVNSYEPQKKTVVTQTNARKNKAEVKAPPAPYPIGLLCRNSSGANVEDFKAKSSSSSSKSSEYPQYTILPPKTPGKIVISTVPQKKIPITEPPKQETRQETRPPKKRRKQLIEDVIEDEVEEPPPAPEPNQHFFTYINLDSMLGPPAVLSMETVQESSVSTTVTPKSNESNRKASRVIAIQPKQQEEDTSVYTCSICDLTFSREKKLVAHVRTHYENNYDDD